MKLIKIFFTASFILLAGCAITSTPALTPLEIQSLQTRDYESPQNIVFSSVISVFQDLGYTVKSADKDTGFIMAESIATSNLITKVLSGVSNITQTSATAFVERIGSITKVRLNFVNSNKSSSVYGQSDRQDIPILDAETYQNAFERIENAIFVRSAN